MEYRSRLEGLHTATGGVIEVADLFAGTSIAMYALEIMQEYWKQTFGLHFILRYKFTAESVSFKRAFGARHFVAEESFADVWDLVGQKGRNAEGQTVPVPSAVIVFAGFECDSISSLNRNRVDNLGCVKNKTGRTGTTPEVLYTTSCIHRHAVSTNCFSKLDHTSAC